MAPDLQVFQQAARAMWINTFSIFDLLAAIITAHVFLAFSYRYFRVSKRETDGLLALVMFFVLSYCAIVFASDNLVHAGTPAWSISHASESAMFVYRLMYVATTFIMISLLHFALRYCESERFKGKHALWLYVAAMGISPICLSHAFLSPARAPRSYTSSWSCAVPWQPELGGLAMVFLALWLSVTVYVQLLFWHDFRKQRDGNDAALGPKLVWSGVALWGFTGVMGIGLGAIGYAGVDTSPPLIAISMLVLAGGLGEEYTQHERERVHVTRRFKSYVDPALVKYVIDHPEHEHFDGEVREMTVVFTDLDGFTPLSEKLREGVVPLLNEYLKVMTPLIREHNGYRNKWLGDGMMFFYGAPERNPDHAIHAVATVLKMQEMMLKFNDSLARQRQYLGAELLPLAMRTGVSTGRMIVGDAGPEDASDYTAIGASVNLGARLESANKGMGTRILLSEQTVRLLPPDLFLIRPIGKLKLVGVARAEMVCEPIAHFDEATEKQKRCAELSVEIVERFGKADFDGCLAVEEQMALEIGPSKFGEVYRQLCGQYLLEPPQAGFAGEIVLSVK